MPAASAAAPPPMSYAQQLQQMQQQQQTAATLLQLQPYIAMLLAAANKDREQLQTRLEEVRHSIVKCIGYGRKWKCTH